MIENKNDSEFIVRGNGNKSLAFRFSTPSQLMDTLYALSQKYNQGNIPLATVIIEEIGAIQTPQCLN